MTHGNEDATLWTLGEFLRSRFPAATKSGSEEYARQIIDAIRAGKIPGIAVKANDGITCWACEQCGKTRSGRGCLVCLERERDALRREVGEAARLSHQYRNERDQALAALAVARTEHDREFHNRIAAEFAHDATLADLAAQRERAEKSDQVAGQLIRDEERLIETRKDAEDERDAALARCAEVEGLAKDILAWLIAPKMETWMYHENGYFAEDAQKVVRRIDAALAKGRGET